MIKKIKKVFLKSSIFLAVLLVSLKMFIVNALAQLDPKKVNLQGTGSFVESFRDKAGFSADEKVGGVISSYISGFLSILGIIFIILIIFAGFRWMNAAGNEEKVNAARDTIIRASIGLAIVVAAYAITFFVFTNLQGIGEGGANTTITTN